MFYKYNFKERVRGKCEIDVKLWRLMPIYWLHIFFFITLFKIRPWSKNIMFYTRLNQSSWVTFTRKVNTLAKLVSFVTDVFGKNFEWEWKIIRDMASDWIKSTNSKLYGMYLNYNLKQTIPFFIKMKDVRGVTLNKYKKKEFHLFGW